MDRKERSQPDSTPGVIPRSSLSRRSKRRSVPSQKKLTGDLGRPLCQLVTARRRLARRRVWLLNEGDPERSECCPQCGLKSEYRSVGLVSGSIAGLSRDMLAHLGGARDQALRKRADGVTAVHHL
jgi:hypothetical protein